VIPVEINPYLIQKIGHPDHLKFETSYVLSAHHRTSWFDSLHELSQHLLEVGSFTIDGYDNFKKFKIASAYHFLSY
jgi:hypothetical protein